MNIKISNDASYGEYDNRQETEEKMKFLEDTIQELQKSIQGCSLLCIVYIRNMNKSIAFMYANRLRCGHERDI